MEMHPLAWIFFLIFAFLNSPLKIECQSYFGIGSRYAGDQLLLRDQLENRHTGLTEVPMIAFNYAIREPITFIEILSDENVYADVNFSYYDTLINGTVATLSSTLEGEKEPFKVAISIYGFNETIPELYAAELLRQKLYYGTLFPSSKPGEVDHMEEKDEENSATEVDLLIAEETTLSKEDAETVGEEKEIDDEEQLEQEEEDMEEDDEEEDEQEEDYENDEDNLDTFESMDKIITVGYRQTGDYLLFQTYQTSSKTTTFPTNHSVTFYFIDSAYITYIEFVLIDYRFNKTKEEIKDSYMIEYSHFSPSTLKAIIRDHKTTSQFAKMSIYGYLPEDLPTHYISYVPEKARGALETKLSTDSPEIHLRSQINALQRDGIAQLPTSFDMLRREGEFENTVEKIEESSPNNANDLKAKMASLPFVLSLASIIIARSLWRLVA